MESRKRTSEKIITNEFGKLVRNFRVQRHWSQQQLADRWGYSREYVSQIERGRRKLDHVEQVNRLADILEIPSERLNEIGKGTPYRKNEAGQVSKADNVLLEALLPRIAQREGESLVLFHSTMNACSTRSTRN